MGCDKFQTDSDLVDAIRGEGARRQEAITCLYQKYWPKAVSLVRRNIRMRRGQTEDTRDLLQDAFLILIEKIRHGGYKDGSLVHFWIGIAKGLFRNKHKRDNRMDLVEDNLQMDQKEFITPEDQLISVERNVVLDQLVAELGERCKNVLKLWMLGYSMREIADKLDLSSEAMARKIKYNCKKQLIERVDNLDIDL